MARIRTIKPSFFSSLTIAALPKPTRITFIGLWCYCDDDGRGIDDARLIKAEIWPLDDDYTTRKIEADIRHLVAAGLVERYAAGDRRYLWVVTFHEHQRINRPQKSKLPAPPKPGTFTEPSVNDHHPRTDDSPPERKGREGKLSTSPPTTHAMAVDNGGGGGDLVDQAIQLAASRYARNQVANGHARSETGLASWWTANHGDDARQRATSLLASHDLTASQLADALVSNSPGWLKAYRRPDPT